MLGEERHDRDVGCEHHLARDSRAVPHKEHDRRPLAKMRAQRRGLSIDYDCEGVRGGRARWSSRAGGRTWYLCRVRVPFAPSSASRSISVETLAAGSYRDVGIGQPPRRHRMTNRARELRGAGCAASDVGAAAAPLPSAFGLCSVAMGKKRFNKAGAVHYHVAGSETAPSREYSGTGDCCSVQV